MSSDSTSTAGFTIKPNTSWDPVEENRVLASVQARLFATPEAPFQLSRYVLVRKLGSGAGGVVYQAYDPELDRGVAVKVLRGGKDQPFGTERARERFMREARLVAKFSHPNVIAVHDVGTFDLSSDDGKAATRLGWEPGETIEGVFIVMEMVEGRDLSSWISDRRRNWREVIEVFLAAGEGLAAAHEAGIVHRDFKPGNVLVGEDGRIKVADFGLALSLSARGRMDDSQRSGGVPVEPQSATTETEITEGGERLTRTGTVLGTPAYMAPEQHRGEEADEKADQYAFCVSLYKALFGALPFRGPSWGVLYNAKVDLALEPVRDTSRDVPPWIRRVLMRGMQPEPEARFPDMRAMLDALRADPRRRMARLATTAAVPLGLAGLAWAGWLATRPGTVVIRIDAGDRSVPPHEIRVDGNPVDPEVPGTVELPSGSHVFEVLADDYETGVAYVEVERASTHEIVVPLRHHQGVLDVDVEPRGGSVIVDGVDYGSRLKNFPIDSGLHEIVVRHEGHYDRRLTIELGHDQHLRHFVALEPATVWSQPRSGSNHELAWIGDADGDGLEDVVHRSFSRITAYDPWARRAFWEIHFETDIRAELADLDDDGRAEVVTARQDDRGLHVQAWTPAPDPKPVPLWSVRLPPSEGGPSLHVTETLERPLVLVTADPGVGIVALDGASGVKRWSVPTQGPARAVLEIRALAGPTLVWMDEELHAADLRDGEPRWSRPLDIDPGAQTLWSALIASTDPTTPADSVEQILVWANGRDGNPRVHALSSADGVTAWTVEVSEPSGVVPVGDLDGDDRADVLIQRSNEKGWALRRGSNGAEIWHTEREARPRALVWDDRLDLLQVEGPRLIRLNPRTGADAEVFEAGSNISGEALTILDADRDGQAELALSSQDKTLYLLDEQLQPQATALLALPFDRMAEVRDGDRDGFPDLLVEARGPTVVAMGGIRWWRRADDAIRGRPLAVDVDADERLELAVTTPFDGRAGLRVFDADTGTTRFSTAGPSSIRGAAAVAGAGDMSDLLVVGIREVLRYGGRDGEVLARRPISTSYARPLLADVDGDAQDEVLVMGWEPRDPLYVLDSRTLSVEREVELQTGGWADPVVVDLDGDGKVEIVVAEHDARVTALDPSDWSPRWSTVLGERLSYGPAVLRRSEEAGRDLAFSPLHPDSPVIVLDGTDGTERWRTEDVGSKRSAPVALDIDDDGVDDLFSGSMTGTIHRLDPHGTKVWTTEIRAVDGTSPGLSGPLHVADLEGDGRFELLSGWEDGALRVFDARTGELLWNFRTGGELESEPVVVDVDGDGRSEVVVASHDRKLYCLEYRPPPSEPQ